MFNLTIFFKTNNLKILQKIFITLKKYKKKFKLILNVKILKFTFKNSKKMSILKSPHVYKTSQEQFTITYFYAFCNFKIISYLDKLLLLFRYLKNYFLEIIVRLNFKLYNSGFQYLLFYLLEKKSNPNKFCIINNKTINSYYKLLDIYGCSIHGC